MRLIIVFICFGYRCDSEIPVITVGVDDLYDITLSVFGFVSLVPQLTIRRSFTTSRAQLLTTDGVIR
jgi:hypothetical protein